MSSTVVGLLIDSYYSDINQVKRVILLFSFLISTRSMAGIVDFSAFYFSDNFATSGSTAAYTRMFYDFYLATSLNHSNTFMVGWDYVGSSAIDNPGTVTTLSTYQMGPKFIYFFSRERIFRIGFAYNLIAQGTYSSGSNSYTWKGTGMEFDFSINVISRDNLCVNIRMNYLSHAFVDQFVGASYSEVTVGRTYIYPTLGVSWLLGSGSSN